MNLIDFYLWFIELSKDRLRNILFFKRLYLGIRLNGCCADGQKNQESMIIVHSSSSQTDRLINIKGKVRSDRHEKTSRREFSSLFLRFYLCLWLRWRQRRMSLPTDGQSSFGNDDVWEKEKRRRRWRARVWPSAASAAAANCISHYVCMYVSVCLSACLSGWLVV